MLPIYKLNKHDGYLQALCTKLTPEYDHILQNVPLYSKRKRLVAEIDILAYRNGYYDAFEVKCSHRLSKARRQLYKIRKILPDRVRNTFFFCGESQTIIEL